MSVEVANESGEPVDAPRLVACARHVLDAMSVDPLVELSVLLVDTEHMTRLHVEHTGEEGPTDVLAFEQDDVAAVTSPGFAAGADAAPLLLGDVVLCPQVAAGQGREAGHGTDAELDLLLTHGVLHLLRYDHADPDGEREMFGLQARLLASWEGARR